MISKNHLHCPLPPCFTARGVVFMLIELILAFHGLNSVSTSRNDYRLSSALSDAFREPEEAKRTYPVNARSGVGVGFS